MRNRKLRVEYGLIKLPVWSPVSSSVFWIQFGWRTEKCRFRAPARLGDLSQQFWHSFDNSAPRRPNLLALPEFNLTHVLRSARSRKFVAPLRRRRWKDCSMASRLQTLAVLSAITAFSMALTNQPGRPLVVLLVPNPHASTYTLANYNTIVTALVGLKITLIY